MDPQATASGAPSWPQQRAPKRQRGKKKSKVAVIIPSAALIPSEEQLLLDDRKRAKSERKLVEDTVMRLRRISADHKREWERLFRHKSALPNSHRERAEDDRLRRAAVLKIMEAREKAGIEPVGAAVQWAELGSADIATELNKKFDKQHFKNLVDRFKAQKSQRRFLDWALQQPNRSGIPARRIEWIRSLLNDTVRLNLGSELIPRMRAVYYIAACCKAAGVSLDVELGESKDEASVEMHNWLLEQEPAFFEQKNFTLDFGYPVDLDTEGLTFEQQDGSNVNSPMEVDSDEEVIGEFYGEEIEMIDEGEKAEVDQQDDGEQDDGEEYVEEDEDEDEGIQPPTQAPMQLPFRERAAPLLVQNMLPEPVLDLDWNPSP